MKKNNITTGILIGISAIILPLILMGTATTQSPTSVVPESHVWEMVEVSDRGFAINKVTGEVKLFVRSSTPNGTTIGLKEYKAMPTAYGEKSPK